MKKPKVVYWDLETLPDPRENYKVLPSIGAWPGRTFKAQLQTIMCFGYMVEGMDAPESINSWELSDDAADDAALVHLAWEMLNDADEIVTHNGKSFDVKVLNTRLAYYGFPPVDDKIKHVDTKQVAKSKLSLYSNSLDNVAKFFGVAEKMHWPDKWGTWERIAFKEATKEDFEIMDRYCKQDVKVLRDIYMKLRPYMGNKAANREHWADADIVCRTCGSTNVHRNGTRRSLKKKYQRYMCGDCGSQFPGTKALED